MITKSKLRLIAGIVIVIIVITVYLFLDTNTSESVVPSFLEAKNTQLLEENKALDQRLQSLQENQAHLEELILERDEKIYHLKQSLNEKVHRINDFSVLELEHFFAKLKTDSLH